MLTLVMPTLLVRIIQDLLSVLAMMDSLEMVSLAQVIMIEETTSGRICTSINFTLVVKLK